MFELFKNNFSSVSTLANELASNDEPAYSLHNPSMVTLPGKKQGLMLTNCPLKPESSLDNPFNAKPADVITYNTIISRKQFRNNPSLDKDRHNEAGWLQTSTAVNPNPLHPIEWKESKQTEDTMPLNSSSSKNWAKRLCTIETKKSPLAKPVQPTRIIIMKTRFG